MKMNADDKKASDNIISYKKKSSSNGSQFIDVKINDSFSSLIKDTVPVLYEELSGLIKSEKFIVVNIEGITKIDSVGLSFLYNINKKLKSRNGKLILVNATDELQKIFHTTKFDQYVRIVKKNNSEKPKAEPETKPKTDDDWLIARREKERREYRQSRRY